MSSDYSCVRPGQQPIPYPRGNIGALRKTGIMCGFPLQGLAHVHIYVPKHGGYNSRRHYYGCTRNRNLSRIIETGQGIGFNVVFFKPGRYVSVKKRAHLAWRGFSCLAVRIYSFQWSVRMRNGSLGPFSQCLYSSNANFTSRSSRSPTS